jgi:hypothetical protein
METIERDLRLNQHPPTCAEVRLALKQTNDGKAPGTDITTEVLKADIETTIDPLQPTLEKIWNEEKVSVERKEGLIIKITKKGDTTNCNNWQGITLLSVPSKVLSRIILNRIKDVVELCLRKEQAGFHRHRSCIDIINTLRINLEQSAEWQATLYLALTDFEKAFNTLNRRIIWKTPDKYSILTKILKLF